MIVLVSANGETPEVKAAISAAIQEEISEISDLGISADSIVVIWHAEPDSLVGKVVISLQRFLGGQDVLDGTYKRVEDSLVGIASKYLGGCEIEIRFLPTMNHALSILSELVKAA